MWQAVKANDSEIVKQLLQGGARPDRAQLVYAVGNNLNEIAHLLHEHGTIECDKQVLLLAAIQGNNLTAVNDLLENGTPPDMSIEYGERTVTPVELAVINRFNEIALSLISYGAQYTPNSLLHTAVTANNITCASHLLATLKDHIDLTAMITYGQTPVSLVAYAKYHGFSELEQLLISEGVPYEIDLIPDQMENLPMVTSENVAVEIDLTLDEMENPPTRGSEGVPYEIDLTLDEMENSLMSESDPEKLHETSASTASDWDILPAEVKEHILAFLTKASSNHTPLLLVNKETMNMVTWLIEQEAKNASLLKPTEQYDLFMRAVFHDNNYLFARKLYSNELFPQFRAICSLVEAYKSTEAGSFETMKKLLTAGVKSDAKGAQWLLKNPPTNMQSETAKKLELLLARGADPLKPIEGDSTFIETFARWSGRPLIKFFKKHPNYSQYMTQALRHKKAVNAVKQNRLDRLQKMLRDGTDLNSIQPVYVKTLLNLALESGFNEIAKFLIQSGANVFQGDSLFRSPLDIAKEHHNIEMINILQPLYDTERKRLDQLYLILSLIEAAKTGDMQQAKALIPYTIVNGQDSKGLTPLSHAVISQSNSIVMLLLSYGASPDLQDSQGWSALFWAIARKNLPLVQLLLAHGADVNMRDATNSTSLSYSLANGCTEITNVLLQHGGSL